MKVDKPAAITDAAITDAGVTDAAARVLDAEKLVRSGRIADGLALADAAWRQLESGTDTRAQADCRRVMAVAFVTSGRLTEALVCGYRALELYEQVHAPEGCCRMLSLQAVTLARHGDPTAALELVQRATERLHEVADAATAAGVWNNLSVAYEALGQTAQAAQAVAHALPLAEAAGEADLVAVCVCNLWLYRLAQARDASPAAEHGPTLEALQALAAHMAECEATGRHHLVGSMADRAGSALAELGRLEDARATLQRGLRSLQQVGVGPDRGRIVLGLAKVERLAQRQGAAHAHMALALELAVAGDAKDLIADCHLEASRLHEAGEDWRAALDSYKRHAEVQHARLRAQAQTAAQVVAVRIEAERARDESRRLHRRNRELERGLKELASEAEQLAQDAHIDPLTGLGNRRDFAVRLRSIEADARRAGGPPVVMLVADIDHFKRINDTGSHLLGDAVLRHIGALLRQLFRPGDAVARFGGEEFVVAFGGGVAPAQALAAAERLRLAIAAHDWQALHAGLTVTVSVGVAQALPGEAAEATLARADAALYAAKNGGRNQVRCA